MFLDVLSMFSRSSQDALRMFFNDRKEFDDLRVLDDPKGISIVSMDFNNTKVYGEPSILDGLVIFGIYWSSVIVLH